MKFATNHFQIGIINKDDFDRIYDVFELKAKKQMNNSEQENKYYIERANTLSKEHERLLLSLIIRNHALYLLFSKYTVSYEEIISQYGDEYNIRYQPFLYKNILIDLLINSLNKYKYPNERNIVGSIYRISKLPVCVEFKVFNDIITLPVKSFTKIKANKTSDNNKDDTYFRSLGDTFIYGKKNEPYNNELYTKRKIYKENKKNRIAFFSVKNSKNFNESKIGILNKIFLEIEMYLSHCLKISKISLEYKEINWKKTKKMNDNLIAVLNSQKYNIINTTEEMTASENLATLLVHAFRKNNIDSSNIMISDKIEPNMINFHIVHSSEYYENNKMHDGYKVDSRIAIQNVIVDSINEETKKKDKIISDGKLFYSNIGNRLLIEGLMKYELVSGISRLSDCYDIKLPEWIFLFKCKVTKESKKIYYFELRFLKNSLHVRNVEGDMYAKIFNVKDCNYAIVLENGNVMKIIETNEFPIPDFEFVYNRFLECEKEYFCKKKDLINIIDQFDIENKSKLKEFDYEKFAIKSNKFRNEILELRSYDLCREEIVKHIPKEKKGFQYYGAFIEYFYYKNGIRLAPLLKKSIDVKSYIAGMYKINYRLEYTKDKKPYIKYVVGKQKDTDFSGSLATAMPFKIVDNCNEDTFRQYATMLAVDFIRINQYTVIPYPFKYLKEYVKVFMKEKQEVNEEKKNVCNV